MCRVIDEGTVMVAHLLHYGSDNEKTYQKFLHPMNGEK